MALMSTSMSNSTTSEGTSSNSVEGNWMGDLSGMDAPASSLEINKSLVSGWICEWSSNPGLVVIVVSMTGLTGSVVD